MKFYIASGIENAEKVKALAEVLKSIGWEHTYDWTSHGAVPNDDKAMLRRISGLETKGVIDSNVVIVLIPGERGTHAELGIAIAYGKKIFLYGKNEECFNLEGRTCSFYHHPNVTQVNGNITKLVKLLKSYERGG